MLKVAGMAEDEPRLMDVGVAKRSGAKEKAAGSRAASGRAGRDEPVKRSVVTGKPVKAASGAGGAGGAASKAPAATSSAAKPKPKMRLVNGKLVPVEDGPRLF